MNENEKKLYMEGYEQACKDINNHQCFTEGYKYGIQVENENIIRNAKLIDGRFCLRSLMEKLLVDLSYQFYNIEIIEIGD